MSMQWMNERAGRILTSSVFAVFIFSSTVGVAQAYSTDGGSSVPPIQVSGDSLNKLFTPFEDFFHSVTNIGGSTQVILPQVQNRVQSYLGSTSVTPSSTFTTWLQSLWNQIDNGIYQVTGIHLGGLFGAILGVLSWILGFLKGVIDWLAGIFH